MEALAGADALVLNQAQIGGLLRDEFIANNVTATENLIAAVRRHDTPYVVHVSSSVVNSKAVDFYTETKTLQERLIDALETPHVVLAADADVRLVRSQASGLAAPLHGQIAGLSHTRRWRISAPAALRRRFLRDHRLGDRKPDRRNLRHFRPHDDRLRRADPPHQGDHQSPARASSIFPSGCSGSCCGSMR